MAKEAAEQNELNEQEAQDFRNEMVKDLWGEGAAGDTPPAEPPENPHEDPPENPTEDPSEPENSVDPWEGVSPALKEQFDSLQGKVQSYDAMAERLKQAESRIGALTNQQYEARKAAEQAAEEAKKKKEEAPTQDEIDAAAKSKEAWDGLKEEFPEWATAMDGRLAAQSAEIEKKLAVTNAIQEKLNEIEKAVTQTPGITNEIAELRQELNEQIVSARYPAWKDTVKSKEFGDFYQTLSEADKQVANSDKAADAINILDKFSEFAKKKPESTQTPANIAKKRKQRLAQSQLPPGAKKTPAKSESNMTDDEYRSKIAQDIWNDDS